MTAETLARQRRISWPAPYWISLPLLFRICSTVVARLWWIWWRAIWPWEQAKGSLQVQRRARALLTQPDPPAVRQRLHQLLATTEGHGADVAFPERWNYDAAQRQAIAQVVVATQRGLC